MARPLASLWALSVLLRHGAVVVEASSSCDPPCQFTVPPANESTCRVYAAVFPSAVVPFYRANETCLKGLNVSETRISFEELVLVCPSRDGTGGDGTQLTNLLREANAEADYLKSMHPAFFELNNSTGQYQLRPFISDRLGQQVDCAQSQAFCWEAINIWFSTEADGQQAYAKLCASLYDRFQNQSAREQTEARRVLCIQGPSSAASTCEPLARQVAEVAGNSSDCEAVTVSADASQIPTVCEPLDGTSSSGRSQRGGTELVLTFVVGLLALNQFNLL